MNTLYLKYAVEVERTGSISQAAENLFMAQPNLSKAIKELENDLGIEIFERSSRGVRLTPKGEVFLKYAENVLEQLEMMEGLSKKNVSNDSFSLCVPYGCHSDKLARLLNDIRKNSGIKLCEADAVQCIERVSDGDFKFGIIRYKTAFDELFNDYLIEKKLESVKWRKTTGAVIFSEKSPLALKKPLDNADFQALEELFKGERSFPRENMNKKVKLDKTTMFGSSAYEMLSDCSDMYMRCAPVSNELLARFGLIQRGSYDEMYVEQIIYRRGYKLSKTDNRYIEQLRVAFAEIGTAL